jgi:hypothetical protein
MAILHLPGEAWDSVGQVPAHGSPLEYETDTMNYIANFLMFVPGLSVRQHV